MECLSDTIVELERGCHARSKGETAMNTKSSRSHAIFTLFLYKTDIKDKLVAVQQLCNHFKGHPFSALIENLCKICVTGSMGRGLRLARLCRLVALVLSPPTKLNLFRETPR